MSRNEEKPGFAGLMRGFFDFAEKENVRPKIESSGVLPERVWTGGELEGLVGKRFSKIFTHNHPAFLEQRQLGAAACEGIITAVDLKTRTVSATIDTLEGNKIANKIQLSNLKPDG